MLRVHHPKQDTELWCKCCDANIVGNMRPSSGNFYLVAGHMRDMETKHFDGDYQSVMFALCNTCVGEMLENPLKIFTSL